MATTTLHITITGDTRRATRRLSGSEKMAEAFALSAAEVSLVCAMRDAWYARAAFARAEVLQRETGKPLSVCIGRVQREIAAGVWRPPLDIDHERARLARLGYRIAATRKRAGL